MWINENDGKKIGMKFFFQAMNKMLSAALQNQLDPEEYFAGSEYEADTALPEYWSVISEVENLLEDILENPDTYAELADKSRTLWWNIHWRFGYELPDCLEDMLQQVVWSEE